MEEAIVGGLAAVVALVRPSALRDGSRFPIELSIKEKGTKMIYKAVWPPTGSCGVGRWP